MTEEVIKKTVELYEIKSELSRSISKIMQYDVEGVVLSNNPLVFNPSINHQITGFIDNEEIKRIVLSMLKSKLLEIELELSKLTC